MGGEVYQAQVLKNFFDTITGTDRNLTRIYMCVISLAKLRGEDVECGVVRQHQCRVDRLFLLRGEEEALLPRLVAARGFSDADDIAAVLHYRVERATARPAGSGRTRKPARLIAGLIPSAHGVIDVEMRAALDEREELIEARADAVLEAALTESTPWTNALGAAPTDRRRAATWRKSERVIAAYRDRYRIIDDAPLGAPPESAAQKIDAARARAALEQMRTLEGRAERPPAGRAPRRETLRCGGRHRPRWSKVTSAPCCGKE